MYYPNVEDNGNSRSMIDTWLGYNHTYRPSQGEFFDMENLSNDAYPVLMPRKKRILLKDTKIYNKDRNGVPTYTDTSHKIKGILYTETYLAYVVLGDEGWELVHGDDHISLSEFASKDTDIGEQTLLRFGSYILIYPMNVCVDINKKTATSMSASVSIKNKAVRISVTDMNGNAYDNITYSDTAPENPNDGDYWVCTLKTSVGLNMYYKAKSSWQPVATCYLRLDLEGSRLTEYFSVGDVVYFNFYKTTLAQYNLDADTINNGSVIQAMGDDYLVILGVLSSSTGYIDYPTSSTIPLNIDRKMPTLDYVCTDKNRVWGCRYGYEADGTLVNEIYCTKLGDPKNWYSYQGLSTDSYAVSVGVPGKWTGCISYGGYPVFFKENAIFRIYGSYPAEYQMLQTNARGVQDGSYKSLAIVGEYLYYKAPGGVMVYDGSTPTMISQAWGKNIYYYEARAGVVNNKYHIIVSNAAGNTVGYFVYDQQYGTWVKEDNIDFFQFSGNVSGKLYASTENEIYGLGDTDSIEYADRLVGEEYVEWYGETGNFGYETPDYKYISRITLRAFIPYMSELKLSVSYDDKPYDEVGVLRGNNDIDSQSLGIVPYRCDHFKLKLEGHGDVRVYSLAMTMDTGSEEDGNTY